MRTDKKEMVRLLIEEALNRGNLLLLNEIVHPEYKYTSPHEEMFGVAALKSYISALRAAFPDLRVSIREQIGECDSVCTRIEMTGTHRGEFLGVPATGKKVSAQGVVLSHFRDGYIQGEWELLDQLTLLQQLGLAAKEA